MPCTKGAGIACTCGILDSRNRSNFFLLKDRDLSHQNPLSLDHLAAGNSDEHPHSIKLNFPGGNKDGREAMSGKSP